MNSYALSTLAHKHSYDGTIQKGGLAVAGVDMGSSAVAVRLLQEISQV